MVIHFRSWMQTIVITSNGKGFYFYAYMEIQIQTHLSNGKLKSVNYLDSPLMESDLREFRGRQSGSKKLHPRLQMNSSYKLATKNKHMHSLTAKHNALPPSPRIFPSFKYQSQII